MKFLDKLKDLFSDEEEIIETQEIEVEENEEHKLPTFMRNKIEEEEKREKEKIQREEKETIIKNVENYSDREFTKTRSNNSFSFPIEMDEPETISHEFNHYSSQNILLKEREKEKEKEKPVASLYSKKEEPKPKKFRPTPVISPIYGVLDKNYTKDDVKVQDESSYEIQRPSRKIDFETVRNKAFGNLTDDIRNNLCENCELYQEVKITKHADRVTKKEEPNLLSDMTDDVPLGVAEENYFDYGVNYETPKRENIKEKSNATVINIDDLEINNEIKIVNHNDEESTAEKIEVKETKRPSKKLLEDTIEFEKVTHDEESADSILNNLDDAPLESIENDIFNLIDSMYDEEEK